MTSEHRLAAVGFHSAELSVQARAGVRVQAERLSTMAGSGQLRTATADFVAASQFAVLTARDTAGRLWISPLVGRPGFLAASTPSTLTIEGSFPDTDPLRGMAAGQPVGLVVIDFAIRRRLRINGVMTRTAPTALAIEIDQAYGNCPKYIRPRHIRHPGNSAEPDSGPIFSGTAMRDDDRRLVERADTFFLGTTHPTAGNDASHRGGPTGFVRTHRDRLWWPDYPGNNLFNTLGNLTVDPAAALLFVDFQTGTTLHLSGKASVVWDDEQPDDEHRTRRGVSFTTERLVVNRTPALRNDS